MKIAVLTLQGAFVGHERMLRSLGVDTLEVRNKDDWQQPKDGLTTPGGESTTVVELLHDLDLLTPIQREINERLPVFGACVGLILLAKQENGRAASRISTVDVDVCRNAYGRQLGSFRTVSSFEGTENDIPMTFIRAPYINQVYDEAETLATVNGRIVAAWQGHQLVTAFRPELDEDVSVYKYPVDVIKKG